MRTPAFAVVTASFALALAPFATPSARAADVLTVQASSFFPVVQAGGVGEGTCTISNQSSSDLRVHVAAHLRFEGVGRSRVIGPTILEIPAGLTFEIAPLFFVPEDAEPGPASMTCRAHVAGPLDRATREGRPGLVTRGEATASFAVE